MAPSETALMDEDEPRAEHTHGGDGLPVADVVPNERGDVVEPFPVQPELHSGVGFIQRHHLGAQLRPLILNLLVCAATLWTQSVVLRSSRSPSC